MDWINISQNKDRKNNCPQRHKLYTNFHLFLIKTFLTLIIKRTSLWMVFSNNVHEIEAAAWLVKIFKTYLHLLESSSPLVSKTISKSQNHLSKQFLTGNKIKIPTSSAASQHTSARYQRQLASLPPLTLLTLKTQLNNAKHAVSAGTKSKENSITKSTDHHPKSTDPLHNPPGPLARILWCNVWQWHVLHHKIRKQNINSELIVKQCSK